MFRRFIERRKMQKLKNSFQSVGEKVQIHESCSFNHNGQIAFGNNISIQRDCTFSGHGGIQIGNGVVISHCVDIFTGEHNYNSDDLEFLPFDERFVCAPVIIGDYVWIGSHTVILPGVKIGEGAVVGACSVVTKDIPACAVAVGNPARVIRYRNEQQYQKLKQEGKSFIALKR